MITKLVICFFSSLALLCDCSACIHQQFKGCSLKFVLYHSLLLRHTWFCRRGSERKSVIPGFFYSPLSFLFSLQSFFLIYWERQWQLLPSASHWAVVFGFFYYQFSSFLTLSFFTLC